MEILELKERTNLMSDTKVNAVYTQFGSLLGEIRKKELNESIVLFLNQQVEQINAFVSTGKELSKQVKTAQNSIMKVLEKDLKIVPKNHYRTTWMVVGMSAFGLPLGVAFGSAIGNMGMLGAGLPIGMMIGIIVGANMDKKAAQEGRQLDIELKG